LLFRPIVSKLVDDGGAVHSKLQELKKWEKPVTKVTGFLLFT